MPDIAAVATPTDEAPVELPREPVRASRIPARRLADPPLRAAAGRLSPPPNAGFPDEDPASNEEEASRNANIPAAAEPVVDVAAVFAAATVEPEPYRAKPRRRRPLRRDPDPLRAPSEERRALSGTPRLRTVDGRRVDVPPGPLSVFLVPRPGSRRWDHASRPPKRAASCARQERSGQEGPAVAANRRRVAVPRSSGKKAAVSEKRNSSDGRDARGGPGRSRGRIRRSGRNATPSDARGGGGPVHAIAGRRHPTSRRSAGPNGPCPRVAFRRLSRIDEADARETRKASLPRKASDDRSVSDPGRAGPAHLRDRTRSEDLPHLPSPTPDVRREDQDDPVAMRRPKSALRRSDAAQNPSAAGREENMPDGAPQCPSP